MAIGKRTTEGARGDRWRGRPVLAALVSLSVFIAPVALSIVAATITAHVLPRSRTAVSLAGGGWRSSPFRSSCSS